MIGAEIDGRYQIVALLGEGGAGTVYRARHASLGREVAVKVLRPEFGASPELRARFEREARALAALSHPNIVGILDSGVAEGQPYLVMELLSGESLADRLRRGPVGVEETIAIVRELLAALAFAHGRGLVHRDVKPANVFLTGPGGGVKLLDFGLAKFTAPEARDDAETRSGQIFGTPAYMSPEQVAGQEVDARVDVYAVGIVAFEMLSGKPPFQGDASEILRQQVVEDLPIARLPQGVPPGVVSFIQKASSKSRDERHTDAVEMLAALDVVTGVARGATEQVAAAPQKGGLGRGLGRLAVALGVLVSIAGIAAAALGAHALLNPARGKERRAVERVLGPAGMVDPFAEGPEPAAAPVRKTPPPEPSELAAEPPPVAAAPSAAPAASASSEPTPAPPAAPRPLPPDPWIGAPAELLRFVAKVNKGRLLDKSEIAAIHLYNAKHLEDPRGHLVLSRSHLRRRFIKDSALELRAAYQVSASATGDPRMLTDLVTLTALGSAEAGRLLIDAFGTGALPALDHELARKTLRPDQRARLSRLRGEITANPGSD